MIKNQSHLTLDESSKHLSMLLISCCCTFSVVIWHQAAWLFDFAPSSFSLRGYVLGFALVFTASGVVALTLALSSTKLRGSVSSAVLLSVVLAPVISRWIVPDLSADASSIHYPLALQIFADVNLLHMQTGSLASERIDLGVGSHILAASTMQLFDTSWNFEFVNSIALGVLLCSLLRLAASWHIRFPVVACLSLVGSVPLILQQFRLGYQDFFPTCMYFALSIEALGMMTSSRYLKRQNLLFCLSISVLAVLGRTTFLAFVIPILIYVCYKLWCSSAAPHLTYDRIPPRGLVVFAVLIALLFVVPCWPMLKNILSGEIPKLMRSSTQNQYWSGAHSWTRDVSKSDGMLLVLFGETAINPEEATLKNPFELPSEAEVSDSGQPDARVAGGGPLVGEVYIFSMALFLFAAYFAPRGRKMLVDFLLLASAIALPIMLLPFNFNYRYFPNYSVLPVITFLGSWFMVENSTHLVRRIAAKLLSFSIVGLLALNSCFTALGVLDLIRSDRNIANSIRSELANSGTQFFAGNRVGLNRHFGVNVLDINDPRLSGDLDDGIWATFCEQKRRVMTIGDEIGVCQSS